MKLIPVKLSSDQVSIKTHTGSTQFTRPHLKFTLAQDEIRELLMGVELYGEPELALRELYQNAIDAIRYREARIEYLEKLHPNINRAYVPKIIFRHDKDNHDREYVECIDNGVGMDRQIFSNVFAKAGKRFSEMSEFVEEQKSWDEYGIKIYPNSQFGVGVLSYFMLADHLEIETTRFEKDGKIGPIISASITGNGNLFRIASSFNNYGNCGTRIRLYLKDNLNLKLIATLEDLIRIPEYDLEVHTEEGIHTREAGSTKQDLIPSGIENVWWCSSETAEVLSDGVRIGDNGFKFYDHYWSEKALNCPSFLYINLKGEFKPKLSVDRKELRNWDKTRLLELVLNQQFPNLQSIQLSQRWFEGIFKTKLADKICIHLAKGSPQLELHDRYRRDDSKLISSEFILKYGLNNDDLEAIEFNSIDYDEHDRVDVKHLEVSFFRACKLLGTDLPDKLPFGWDSIEYSKLKTHEMISSSMNRSLRGPNGISVLANLSFLDNISLTTAYERTLKPVSYTHLTLPTIYSV